MEYCQNSYWGIIIEASNTKLNLLGCLGRWLSTESPVTTEHNSTQISWSQLFADPVRHTDYPFSLSLSLSPDTALL